MWTRVGSLRFDGDMWSTVRPLGGEIDHPVTALAGNAQGVLWAAVSGPDGERLARFDGGSWTAYPEDLGQFGQVRGLQVGPDGSAWFLAPVANAGSTGREQTLGVPVRFDGATTRTYAGVTGCDLPPPSPGPSSSSVVAERRRWRSRPTDRPGSSRQAQTASSSSSSADVRLSQGLAHTGGCGVTSASALRVSSQEAAGHLADAHDLGGADRDWSNSRRRATEGA